MATTELPTWLRTTQDGCVIDVAVQPGAKRSELSGLHDGALRIRVAAPALDGRGNAALCDWLATQLDCPKRAVQLLRGDKSRRKQLAIALPPHTVRERLEAQLRVVEPNLFQ